jgi:hypothetical protein
MTSENFNNLTPAETERLAMLAEECAEVIQVVGKILRHGYDSSNPTIPKEHGVFIPTNFGDLIKELRDIQGVIYGMVQARDLPRDFLENEEPENVWQKKLKWTHHQDKN